MIAVLFGLGAVVAVHLAERVTGWRPMYDVRIDRRVGDVCYMCFGDGASGLILAILYIFL